MKTFTEEEVEMIIDKCFRLGVGGWDHQDDREEYMNQIHQFIYGMWYNRTGKDE